MTVIAVLLVAVPVVAGAALAVEFLRNQAMRFDKAPLVDTGVCVEEYFVPAWATEESPEKIRVDECSPQGSEVRLDQAGIEETSGGRVTPADRLTEVRASYLSLAFVPELSPWPFTRSEDIEFRMVPDTGSPSHLFPLSSLQGNPPVAPYVVPTEAEVAADAAMRRDRLMQVQRTLNHQVLLLAGGATGLLLLIGVVVWVAVGRVLRPVESIRREMADITAHDLARRVPVPRARNEIAALVTTVNSTLDRLETAVEDNRRFVADASHELRSPITALRAELEIATAHPGLTDWPVVVDAALADTERLQHLATDLLLLARLDHATAPAGHTDTVDLTALVAEHVARRRGGHLLTTALPDHAVPVPGSHVLLERLLANLLDNADRHATTTVEVRLTTTEDQAVLEVLDDGPGIPPDDRDRVFDRFTRLDHSRTRDTGGTGLGLPIARRIALSHGGTLHATRHPAHRGARLVATFVIPGEPTGDRSGRG
ncbi:HAMP domain-containing sensor histidine kinase [Actinosynnema sp. NPDC020468]|uniref:sensor histidine kinase n=1 Tax=Actinosynnema sp. NPDC020468 TaxID=3154488 RepID=UPI0033E37180